MQKIHHPHAASPAGYGDALTDFNNKSLNVDDCGLSVTYNLTVFFPFTTNHAGISLCTYQLSTMKIITLLLAAACFSSCDTLLKAGGTVFNAGGITEQEASSGIREALAQGVGKGIAVLNQQDGFFGNEAYKLFLPEDAVKIANTLKAVGLGSQVDKAVLQINRAAEDAVGYAKPVFTDAIRQMTLADALNIVRGPNNAATTYFREKTRAGLVTAFAPSIKSSLDKLSATKYYTDIVTTYNNFPTTFKKVNPDLVDYVAGRATDALFDRIEKEEANIRANPLARTTAILKKVFGIQL